MSCRSARSPSPSFWAALDWLARAPGADREDARAPAPLRRRVCALRPVLQLTSRGAAARWRRWGTTVTASAGKLQVNWGLVCSPDGRPVSVQVHPGNTADPTTVPEVIDTVKERFGIERVILVGDRAMITDAHAATLKAARRRVRLRAEERADPQADERGRAAALAVRSEEPGRDHLRGVRRRALRGVPQPAPRRRARPQTRGPAGRDRTRTGQGQTHGRRPARHSTKPPTPEDRRARRPRL